MLPTKTFLKTQQLFCTIKIMNEIPQESTNSKIKSLSPNIIWISCAHQQTKKELQFPSNLLSDSETSNSNIHQEQILPIYKTIEESRLPQ